MGALCKQIGTCIRAKNFAPHTLRYINDTLLNEAFARNIIARALHIDTCEYFEIRVFSAIISWLLDVPHATSGRLIGKSVRSGCHFFVLLPMDMLGFVVHPSIHRALWAPLCALSLFALSWIIISAYYANMYDGLCMRIERPLCG